MPNAEIDMILRNQARYCFPLVCPGKSYTLQKFFATLKKIEKSGEKPLSRCHEVIIVMNTPDSLALLLQGSITPAILFSGIGFFLMMLGNTLPRPAEQIRQILKQLRSASPENRTYLENQIRVLYRRCRYLRSAIAFTTLGMICIFIMITSLFFQQFYNLSLEGVIKAAFVLNKIVMVAALCCFLQDVRLKLRAVKGDIARNMHL